MLPVDRCLWCWMVAAFASRGAIGVRREGCFIEVFLARREAPHASLVAERPDQGASEGVPLSSKVTLYYKVTAMEHRAAKWKRFAGQFVAFGQSQGSSI